MCSWKFVVPSFMCNLICVPCSWHLSYKWMASLTILNFLWCPSLFSFDFFLSFFGVNLCRFLFHITIIYNLYFCWCIQMLAFASRFQCHVAGKEVEIPFGLKNLIWSKWWFRFWTLDCTGSLSLSCEFMVFDTLHEK